MKDYKRNLQLKILDIVKEIDRICNLYSIEYYLIYGSALGAVRHQGFIPWDDDFDIGMTYENYNKFIKVCDKELNKNKFFLQTPDNEPNYYLSFMKLRDITTTLIEEGNKNKNITYGVYVDIFPIVGVPKQKLKRKILEINRAFALSANINVINSKILFLVFRIILKTFGKKNILKICTKNCVKYSCNDYEDWCSIFDGDGFVTNLTTKTIMGKPTRVQFEDIELPIPEKSDEYLKHIYGDYMKLPTKEQIKQKEHTPYINV
ncbi:MAG: LicD family protein [Candidatus Gastranaerophilaceae bacterium]